MRACGLLTDQLDSPLFHLSLGHPGCSSEVLQRPPALVWCSPRQGGLCSCQRASQGTAGYKQSYLLGIRWLEVPGVQGSEVACPSARLLGVLLEDRSQGPRMLGWAPFQGLYGELHTLVGHEGAVAKETERPGPGNLLPLVLPNCHASTPGHALP